MNKIYILIVVIVYGCSINRTGTTYDMKPENAIKIALNDFKLKNNLYKQDSIFNVNFEEINKDILGVSIIGAVNKIMPAVENEIGTKYPYFPTRYLEIENKLFYWYDSAFCITEEIITVLSKYNQIDSVYLNQDLDQIEFTIDDSKRAVHYYFCRYNLNIFKKVNTRKAMGYYKLPRIKCK